MVKESVMIISAINYWNETQNILEGQSLKSLYPTKIKNIFTKRCINKYLQFVKMLEKNCIRIDIYGVF